MAEGQPVTPWHEEPWVRATAWTGLAGVLAASVIAAPAAIPALGSAIAAHTRRDADMRTRLRAGLLAWIAMLPFLGGITITLAISSTLPQDPIVDAIIVSAVTGWGAMVSGPLLLALRHTTRPGFDLRDALVEGWLDASALGLLRTLWVGLVHGAILVLAFAVGVLSFGVLLATGSPLVLLGLATAPSVFLAGGVLAFAWATGQRATGATHSPRGWVAASVLLTGCLSVALAAGIALPMQVPDSVHAGLESSVEEAEAAGLFVASHDRTTVEVRSTDGAHHRLRREYLRWPLAPGPPGIHNPFVAVARDATGATWWVRDGHGGEAGFDRAGHRLDDGLSDRLLMRFGEPGAWGLLAAAIFAGLALLQRRRASRELQASSFDAPSDVTLELAQGAEIRIVEGCVRSSGDAWVTTSGGDRVMALTSSVPWLGPPDAELGAGARLQLGGSDVASLGPRNGSKDLPNGVWLSDRRESFVARARHLGRACAIATLVAATTAMATAAWALIWL